MFRMFLLLSIAIKLVWSVHPGRYRQDGNIIIGAILPLSESNSECDKPNLKGNLLNIYICY